MLSLRTVQLMQTSLVLVLMFMLIAPIFSGIDGTREPRLGWFESIMSAVTLGLGILLGVEIWT